MSSAKKIAFNTLVQLISKFITVATSVVVVAYLTRYLGVSGYGDYATVFAYLGIFSVFVDLGLFVISVREIAERPEDEKVILGNMLSLRLIVGLVVFGLAYIISLGLPYSGLIQAGILIGAVSHFFMSLNQVPLSSFQARLVMHKAAIADILGRIVLLGLVVWFIYSQLGFLYLIAAVAVSNLVVFLLNMFMFELQVIVWPIWDIVVMRKLLLTALPMGVVVILATIYFRIDTVMLSMMKGSFDVGIYGAPYKILEVFLAIPSIFMSSVLPVITKALSESREKALNIFKKSFDFLSLAALPLIAGTIVLATPIMVLIAGDSFKLSGPVLQILILALGGAFLNSAMIYTIIAANQQKRLVLPYVVAVIFNIVTNFLVIPYYSYFGAAGTTVATELFVLIVSAYIVYKYIKLTPSFVVFGKALLASILMGLGLTLFNLHVVWVALIGAVTYALLLVLFKTVSKQDLINIMPKLHK